MPQVLRFSLSRFLTAVLALGLVAAIAPSTAVAKDTTTTYVLADGSHAGTSIKATEGGGVDPINNVETQAAGVIAPDNVDCDTPHFNGLIFGEADPAPSGCGQGRVVAKKDQTKAFAEASKAVADELSANEAHNSAGKPITVKDGLKHSITAMSELKKEVEKQRKGHHIDDAAAAHIAAQADLITEDDKAALNADKSGGNPSDFGPAIADALPRKAEIVNTLRAADLLEKSTISAKPISAKFFQSDTGACDVPNLGETCYATSAKTRIKGGAVTFGWSLAPPIQDTDCIDFFHLPADTTKSVWHHFDTDQCEHAVQGPDGHEGVVTAVMKDGTTTCVATYLGTKDSPDPNKGHDPVCHETFGKFVLTVVKGGWGGSMVTGKDTGEGTVTSSPDGIDCGASCASAGSAFDKNAMVTLTAVAASGATFEGWTGAGCSGTSTCVVTMSTDKTVNATFSAPE